jgi:hypothetical protein
VGIASEIVQLDQLKAEPPPQRTKHQAADTPEAVDPNFECKLAPAAAAPAQKNNESG